MRNQNARIVIYSSLAFILLALVWGFRQIPMQQKLAEKTLSASLEQEMVLLNSAVKASIQALKYNLLDVLKAEGNDKPTRAFQDSPFFAASLLEWDASQWKPLWFSSKTQEGVTLPPLKDLLMDWPISKLANDEVYVGKVKGAEGESLFVVLVPVRRPGPARLVGVGIFPASRFGLDFSADPTREIKVFDEKGFALALTHPAYLGAALTRDNLVKKILAGEEVSLNEEWKNDSGQRLQGVVSRIRESNLYASIETKMDLGSGWAVRSWLYLLLCTLGAAALNWVLFSNLLKPLMNQLLLSEQTVETLKKQVSLQPRAATPTPSLIPSARLAHLDFEEIPAVNLKPSENPGQSSSQPMVYSLDEAAAADSQTTIQRVVQSALRSLDSRLRKSQIEVKTFALDEIDIDTDPLQLQTAIEEIIKNAIESMEVEGRSARTLRIGGHRLPDRVRLSIDDSGIGIEDAHLEKVFDPFYSTKDTEGVARGLGLNVVRRVVEELGGQVRLTSELNHGTRVEMDWPIGGAELSAETPMRKSDPVVAADEDDDLDGFMPMDLNGPAGRDWPDVEIRRPKVRI